MDPSTWLTSYPAVYFTLAVAGFPLPVPEDGVLMLIKFGEASRFVVVKG